MGHQSRLVKMGIVAGVLVLGAVVAGVLRSSNGPMSSAGETSTVASVDNQGQSSMQTIDVQQLREELKSPKAPVLVDVREPSEHAAAAIGGDKNIPLGEIPKRYTEIPKDEPVVVYCRSGNRSSHAVMMLQQLGYTNVKNLTGGITAWLRGQ